MPRFNQRNFLPGRDTRRRHVAPSLAAVGRQMNQTIIGSAPDAVHIEWRWRDRVNHAATMRLLRCIGFVLSDARRQVVLRSRSIRADLFPVLAAVARFPECVSSEEKQMRIDG